MLATCTPGINTDTEISGKQTKSAHGQDSCLYQFIHVRFSVWFDIWWCIDNLVFLRLVVTYSHHLIEVHDLNGCHDNQTQLWRVSNMVTNKRPTVIAFKCHISHDFTEIYFLAQGCFMVATRCVGWCFGKKIVTIYLSRMQNDIAIKIN